MAPILIRTGIHHFILEVEIKQPERVAQRDETAGVPIEMTGLLQPKGQEMGDAETAVFFLLHQPLFFQVCAAGTAQ